MRKTAVNNYGRVKTGRDYRVLDFGIDFYRIVIDGKVMYVPLWVFDDDDIPSIYLKDEQWED